MVTRHGVDRFEDGELGDRGKAIHVWWRLVSDDRHHDLVPVQDDVGARDCRAERQDDTQTHGNSVFFMALSFCTQACRRSRSRRFGETTHSARESGWVVSASARIALGFTFELRHSP